MKILSLLAFFISFCLFGQLQNLKQLDSLENKIKLYPKKDTVYIKMRLDYAKNALFLKPSDTTLLKDMDEVIELSKKLNYSKGIALANIRKGAVYHYFLDEPYKALDCYNSASDIIEKQPSLKKYMADVLINIGNIYNEQKESKKALQYYRKSIQYGESKNIYQTYSNMGTAYGEMNKSDSAIYYYQKSINLTRKNNNFLFTANNLSNLALILLTRNENEKAQKAIDEALELVKKYNLAYAETAVYVNAATVYKFLGKLSDSKSFALKALNTQGLLDNLFMQKSIWGTLSEVYEAEGDYKNSVDAYKKFMKASDSLTSENRRVEISRKQMQYESDKKETLAKAEIGKQKIIRNAIITISFIALLAGVFLFLGFRKRQKIKAEQKEILLKAEISETELKALRAQMNPHFIFNALNSIADYINKNDAKSADYYLGKFAKLMRGILENSEEKEIPLSEELKMLEFYMDLESLRFKNKFNYEVKIADDINPENVFIPPMILQPFVENSILHGLAKKDNEGRITIQIDKTENLLKCIIEDNGIGRKNPNENLGKSYGVKLTRERIALFEKSKNSDSGVFYTDLEAGTRVELRLPLEEI